MVLRCLWALDPERHLFLGDFRDYARQIFDVLLTAGSLDLNIPESCVDEIAKLVEELPASDSTRLCWQRIAAGLRCCVQTVRIMYVCPDDKGDLEDFVRGTSDSDLGGGYCLINEKLPAELLKSRRQGFNGTLEAIAFGCREHLDPSSLTGAILLWAIWCLETKWPEGRLAGHFRTTFSLSWQLEREIASPGNSPGCWGISRLLLKGANLRLADSISRGKRRRASLAHGFAVHASARELSRLHTEGLALDDPDEYGMRPIHCALLAGKRRAAAWLLAHGVDPNSSPRYLDPPLLICVEKKGPYAMFASMVACGADPHVCGQSGRTALHLAAYAGRLRVVNDLIGRAAELEVLDSWDHTPLFRAVFAMVAGGGSRMPVIKALVAAGANPCPSNAAGISLKEFLKRAEASGASTRAIKKILKAII